MNILFRWLTQFHLQRLRDGSEDTLNTIPLFQKASLSAMRGFSLPLFVPPLDHSEASEDSDNSPMSLPSLPCLPSPIVEIEMDDELLDISPKTRTMNRNFPRPARL